MSDPVGDAFSVAADSYTAACDALIEAQAFYDRSARFMEDGPRATALAALATARFAQSSAAVLLLQTSGAMPR